MKRSRINIAELPLPNAKSWLFGDDFPSLASKQAELSRGLTKNLAQSAGKSFPRRSNSSQSQSRPRVDTFNKYQSTRYSNPPNLNKITKVLVQTTGLFRSPHQKGRQPDSQSAWCLGELTLDPQILSIVSGYKIVFPKIPFQKSQSFTQASGHEAFLISHEDNELLQKGALHETFFTR